MVAPADPRSLKVKEMRNALNLVTLIKKKKDSTLKERACVDGRRQKYYIMENDIDISTPTVSLEGLMASLSIDTYEDSKVSIFDVSGTFLQPELPRRDDRLLLKFKILFAEIMCEVSPEFRKTLIIERVAKTLYIHASISIYGCLEAAILW